MTNTKPLWRPMAVADLDNVNHIAGQTHAALPERTEVLAEKFRLFPRDCFIFQSDKAVVGYAIAHPGRCERFRP